MNASSSGGKTSKGTGYLVLAIPFGLIGLLLLTLTLSEYGCNDPTPKQCLLEDDKLEVLLTGLMASLLLLGTAAAALFARLRPEHRPTLNPVLVTTSVIAMAGLLYFLVVLFAASIRSTT